MALDPFMGVHEMAQRLVAGQVTSRALVAGYLERIAAWDGRLGAYIDVYADEALQAAQAADLARASGSVLGPLHGVPIAVKDLYEIEGHVTTAGSAAYRDRRSALTATLVRRLRAQGMVLLGKTHTVEFAMGSWGTNQRLGTPLNPWDLEVARTPGGSSSGSGVAVAAGLAPWALGTDTGGSVRLPASWCNLTALKVSTGRFSTYGVMPLSSTLDTPGPMARDVQDVGLLYESLRGYDPLDELTAIQVPREGTPTRRRDDLRGLRLARMPERERAPASAEVLRAYDATLQVLEQAGAQIVDADLPYGFEQVAELNGRIMQAEGYSFHAELLEDPAQPLDETVRPRLLAGRDIRATDYLQALRKRRQMQRELVAVFDAVDALLAPTTPTAPIPVAEVDPTTASSYYTRFANFFNLPALALPSGATPAGLPLSVQIIGRPYAEQTVLEIGRVLQAHTRWHLRTPQGMAGA